MSLSRIANSIISSPMVYMANKDSNFAKIKTIKELNGWTVATVRASTVLKVVKSHQAQAKNLAIKEEVDYLTVVRKLKTGQYPKKILIAGTEDVLKYFSATEETILKPIYSVLDQQFIVAFSKKKFSADEQVTFNKVIFDLKKNGKIKNILAKHLLRPAS